MKCVTAFQLISKFIFFFLNRFSVTVNCVTFNQFSSQYILLLFQLFCVKLNCVTVIQFTSQYILLLLQSFGIEISCVIFSVQISFRIIFAQLIWCFSEFYVCYLFHFSMHTLVFFISLPYGTACFATLPATSTSLNKVIFLICLS